MIDQNVSTLDSTTATTALSEGVLTANLEGHILGLDLRFLELWELENTAGLHSLDVLVERLLEQARGQDHVRRTFFEPELSSRQEVLGSVNLLTGRQLEMRRRPALRGTQKIGWIWSVRDSTHEKRIEQRIHQAEKMAAIGRLVGGISHDFNNLLTVIRGYCDLSMARLKADHPPIRRLQDSVGEITKAAERAAELTGQLLAYSRQQMVSPRTLDLNLELQDLEKMLLRLVSNDVRLSLQLEADPATVQIDPGQLQQLVMNLVINARDAMPDGGEIFVRTEAFTIDHSFARRFDYPVELGPQIMLCVRDTGVGIAPELQHRIFEPFFTTKEVGRGTGLGLATVYGITKQSGGYIWVDSQEGVGTEFRICLPRVIGEIEKQQLLQTTDTAPPRGESILVVDDEDQVREVIVHLLTDAGYRVRSVARPRQALELQRAGERFDLLITDLSMPEMDGTQLAQLMADQQGDLAVLFTSGYHPDAFERRGVLPAGAAILPKPLDARALRRKVSEAFR